MAIFQHVMAVAYPVFRPIAKGSALGSLSLKFWLRRCIIKKNIGVFLKWSSFSASASPTLHEDKGLAYLCRFY